MLAIDSSFRARLDLPLKVINSAFRVLNYLFMPSNWLSTNYSAGILSFNASIAHYSSSTFFSLRRL